MTSRLRRSDCAGPGLHRRRRGRGFSYLDERGEAVRDRAVRARIDELAIPPAWREVWICPDPRGHLQATGIDDAGRKQYLYHPLWRQQRDRQKFKHVETFGTELPRLRRRVDADISGELPTRERVLAAAVRLLDIGFFRIGGAEYADEDGGLGLSTLGRKHVAVSDGTVQFDFPAKSGVRWTRLVQDPASVAVIATLKRRRGGPDGLLAHREHQRWRPVSAADINDYIKDSLGETFSAKDFRTWNGTVLAAIALGGLGPPPQSRTARTRALAAVTRTVADGIGNTPAVARRAYIDPRVFDRYLAGATIGPDADPEDLTRTGRRRRAIEREVLRLLSQAGS